MTTNTVQYKMGGPSGVTFFALLMTLYTYFITLKVQMGDWALFSIPTFDVSELFNVDVTLATLVWFLAQCVLYCVPVGGQLTKGTKLENGQQLEYNTNAFMVLHLNLVVCLISPHMLGVINQRLLSILTSSVVLCFGLSVLLYLKGTNKSGANKNGNTGNIVYDWFMGRELNPRILTVDLKYVMFRSGIIGWIIFNTCNCAEYYIRFGVISPTLLTVSLLQYSYVADYFWYEHGVIVSRDIVHEGLGYNILIQFLMIPFCFSVQTRYILTQNYQLNNAALVGVIVLYVVGFYIYRASNSEKNNFRKDPDDPKLSHLKTMSTSSGKKLLISGWWGRCRHPNYLGDLLMSSSYALATGFYYLIPYLGTIILVMLLLDREQRDGDDCKRKYGADWEKYCKIVKYRIVPGIY